jgi:hypothetical protein
MPFLPADPCILNTFDNPILAGKSLLYAYSHAFGIQSPLPKRRDSLQRGFSVSFTYRSHSHCSLAA